MDITEVPMLTAASIVKRTEMRKNAIRRACIILCIFFMLTSVAAHIIISANVINNIAGTETAEVLIRSVIPGCEWKVFAQSSPNMPVINEESPDTKAETSATESIPDEGPAGEDTVDGIFLKNETSYNPDLQILYNSPNPIDKADKLYERYLEGSPLVLIYHSHATESYQDSSTPGSFRSPDPSKNMVAVGEVIARCLEANGIKAIHLTEMFDIESYSDAYYNSSAAVEKVLREHPSIKYILDIHRDSITDKNGNNVGATLTWGDTTAAQLMFVVGTDEGGSGHTEWRQNLTAALHLQKLLLSQSPSLMRPINLRKASFFQDRSPGAMLVEVGSCGNTLAEAKRSAAIFSSSLSEYILGEKGQKTTEELIMSFAK